MLCDETAHLFRSNPNKALLSSCFDATLHVHALSVGVSLGTHHEQPHPIETSIPLMLGIPRFLHKGRAASREIHNKREEKEQNFTLKLKGALS